ncbi:TPA: hypothetical protein ACG5BG_002891 [Pseudomonas aeruginosa]
MDRFITTARIFWFSIKRPPCQSGLWVKLSLSVTGKESLGGPVTSYMSYVGTDSYGVDTYCRDYSFDFSSDGLIITNLRVAAVSTQTNRSEVISTIIVNNKFVAQNYSVATQPAGGFFTSTSSTESVRSGVNTLRLCGGVVAVTGPTVVFSVSLIQ